MVYMMIAGGGSVVSPFPERLAVVQWSTPATVLREHADYILDNSGSAEELREQVKTIYGRLINNQQM